MRIAFAGTPAFARVALEALHAAGHEVVCVLTQPDRPAGRGLKLQASEVKLAAEAMGVTVLQPAGLRLDGRHAADALAARSQLEALAPEAIVVAAYGLLLPNWTLALPHHGCLNIHASLLPRWRGAAPIHRAIEAGDAQTGVCIMQMDAGLDTGDILDVAPVRIAADATTGSLHDVLAALGARAICAVLAQKAAATDRRVPQSADGVTYAAKIDKRESLVDWQEPAVQIERRLRAFDPTPGVTAVSCDGEAIKLWRAHVVEGVGAAGTVLAGDDAGITVACGSGALVLTDLQRPGGRRGSVAPLWQHWQRIADSTARGFRLPAR